MSRLDREDVRRANPLEAVVAALTGRAMFGENAERKALCPWHEDHTPSLRVNVTKQLWRCDPCNLGGDVFAFVQRHQQCDFRAALFFFAERAGLMNEDEPASGHVVETYDYTDETGTVRYQTVRFEPKTFRQRRPTAGGWTWTLNGAEPLVYRRHRLAGHERIFVCEGEKDCDRLWSLGLPATCNHGGAGKWKPTHAEQLRAAGVRSVDVLPDNDEAGQRHAGQVATACLEAGLDVRVLKLPDLPLKGDVSDWLEKGRTSDELVSLAEQAPPWRPKTPAAGKTNPAEAEPLTEAGAAERFARLHGNDVRYDHYRSRWLIWQQHRWVPDADAAVTRVALEFARTWQLEATEIADSKQRGDVFRFANQLERRTSMNNMLALAHDLKPVADAGHDWDANPHLLGVPNGVVDLNTGMLRPGSREDRITMSTFTAFDPAATCSRWERFALEVFDDDAEMVAFVQRAIGYSLSGVTTEQCLFMLYGTGANGKGTFANTIKWVLGDYAWNMPFATIEMRDRSAIPNDVAALKGRRFVTASETNDGTRINEARVKALTGCDPITARFLHGEFFTFEPVAKFWLSANHKPIVHDDSYGFWRRIRLIPFTQTFGINPALADDLRAEGAGILAWAIRGCLAWREEGLNPPAKVMEATAEYEADSNPLQAFLDEACELADASEVGAADLFAHYRQWADNHGLSERERLSATAFGRKLSERCRHERRRSGKVYLGLARRAL